MIQLKSIKNLYFVLCAGFLLNTASGNFSFANTHSDESDFSDDDGWLDGDTSETKDQISLEVVNTLRSLVKEGTKLVVPAALVGALYYFYTAGCTGEPDPSAISLCQIITDNGILIYSQLCELITKCMNS